MVASLHHDVDSYYTMPSDADKLHIDIDDVFLMIRNVDGLLKLTTHPKGNGVLDNETGQIQVSLNKAISIDDHGAKISYPTLRKGEYT